MTHVNFIKDTRMMVIFDDASFTTAFYILPEETVRSLSRDFAEAVLDLDDVLRRSRPFQFRVIDPDPVPA